jgi:hypothetical protein
MRYMLAVPGRAKLVAHHLRTLNKVFQKLFADENFIALLRAEDNGSLLLSTAAQTRSRGVNMRAIDEDGGESQRQWHRGRRENLLALTGELPKDLCRDEIMLTICCRYAESLLKNPRVNKYLPNSTRMSGEDSITR